jgi:cytochrome c5
MKQPRSARRNPGDVRIPAHRKRLLLAAAVLCAAGAVHAADRSGKEVVDAACIVCHATGKSGAPKIGDRAAWAPLEARGLTALGQSALKGIRDMPSHGGNPGFSDTEIERAITYMVNQSGGHWTEPVSRSGPTAGRTGEQIVKSTCSECHATGKGGAPKIGDRQAWIPRVKPGFDVVVASAIKGHGGMPARGGKADLTDAEVRSAIIYMMNADVMKK